MEHRLGECRKDASLVGVWVIVVFVRYKRYCMSERSSASVVNLHANVTNMPSYSNALITFFSVCFCIVRVHASFLALCISFCIPLYLGVKVEQTTDL